MTERPVLAFIGGFLGAGKTSLIRTAAHTLEKQGLRVAAIMNDQDAGLVDTRFTEANGIQSGEVAGGCFCCRFSDLMQTADALKEYRPDVILAEPVGSCIDLAATLVHPLKLYYSQQYRVAPITVLFDPAFAARVSAGETDPDIDYLFRKQIQEADIVCASKSDLHLPGGWPAPVDFSLSARTGENVENWLNELLHGGRVAGSQLLQVDYSRYAEAEAALGWLNLHARVYMQVPVTPSALAGPVLEDLRNRLLSQHIGIAHLKLFNTAESGYIKASICSNDSEPQIEGDLMADPSNHHELALNLRAIADPSILSEIVSLSLKTIAGRVDIMHQKSFRPAPPQPEHRMVG